MEKIFEKIIYPVVLVLLSFFLSFMLARSKMINDKADKTEVLEVREDLKHLRDYVDKKDREVIVDINDQLKTMNGKLDQLIMKEYNGN